MNATLSGTEPILCASVIREVDRRLVELLGSLTTEELGIQTVAPQWKVRDVAAHLLDTALRKLSMGRDRCRIETVDIRSHDDVIRLVNRLNSEGVTVYRRLSPRILTMLMERVCAQTADYYESLDPFAEAAIGVSWAGERTSLNWFDVARELTERWHHQQQIRMATGRSGIMTSELYHPVLDTFLRGLPHTFREVSAAPGTAVMVEVTGECGGRWCLVRSEERWGFSRELPRQIGTQVTIPQSIAWQLFTKGLDRELARSQTRIAGDLELGSKVLQLVAIVG